MTNEEIAELIKRCENMSFILGVFSGFIVELSQCPVITQDTQERAKLTLKRLQPMIEELYYKECKQ